MSDTDVHTCHAECPCQTGGEPLPDFPRLIEVTQRIYPSDYAHGELPWVEFPRAPEGES